MSTTTKDLQWNEYSMAQPGMRCDGCGQDMQSGERYGVDVSARLRYGSLCGCATKHDHPDFDLDAFLAS